MQGAVVAFAEIIHRLEQHSTLDHRSVAELALTFAIYGDRWHHAKEGFLISQMLARGRSADEYLIRTFYDEHYRVQSLLTNLKQAADQYSQRGDSVALADSFRQAVDFYPGHMWKADHLLFPMADAVLSVADQKALLEQFDSIEGTVGREMQLQLRMIVEEFRDTSR